MWPSLLKIQYTELKLSCGNDPVFKISIYSNGDLELWPNDPKINRVLPLPQGNHVAKLVKIRYTELKLLCGNLCGCPPLTIPNHIICPVIKSYGPDKLSWEEAEEEEEAEAEEKIRLKQYVSLCSKRRHKKIPVGSALFDDPITFNILY
jgi:hypothetical protein